MDWKLQHHELSTIYNEYKDFFPEMKLKLSNGLLSNLNDGVFSRPNHLIIKSDDIYLKVSVDLAGWFIIGDSHHYETFETLMMQKSVSFNQKFHSQLVEKLDDLED